MADMRPRQHLSSSLTALAKQQAGVLTTRQLLDGGFSRGVIHRMAKDWLQPAHGLYLTSPPTWQSAAWAGVLKGGPDAVVGGQAAAHLHDLLVDPPNHIVVATLRQARGFTVGKWTVGFRRVPRVGVGTPERSKVEPTLLDMARDSTEDTLVAALTCALAERKTIPERVLAELQGRRRVAHSPVVRALCEHACRGIESALEWRFHTSVLLPHHLPIPERQVSTHEGRVDGLYRAQGLLVELDGSRFHTPSEDRMRDNEHLIVSELRTLRYGWYDVVLTRCTVAAQVARALRKWGWVGNIRPCPSCPSDVTS